MGQRHVSACASAASQTWRVANDAVIPDSYYFRIVSGLHGPVVVAARELPTGLPW